MQKYITESCVVLSKSTENRCDEKLGFIPYRLYNFSFYVVFKSLGEEIILNTSEKILYMVFLTPVYLLAVYCWYKISTSPIFFFSLSLFLFVSWKNFRARLFL